MRFAGTIAARRPGTAGLRLVALVLAMSLAHAAGGQGMMGMLPEPISSSDLIRYAERLDLSEAQWPAAEAAHDAYKRRFQDLSDTVIAEMLEQMSTGAMMSDVGAVEKSLKRMDEAFQSIANLDRRFFDDLQSVLSDAQIAALQRVRDVRERQRYRGLPVMMLMMGSAPLVDVGELFYELDLPAPHRAQADPLVEQHERRMTAEMRELREMSTETILTFYTAFLDAELMVPEEPAPEKGEEEDPAEAERRAEELQQRQMQRMQEVYETALAAPLEKLTELRDASRRAVRRIAEAMPEDSGRRLRLQYYRAEQPQLGHSILNAHRWGATMRGWDDVDSAHIDTVQSLAGAYFIRIDPLLDRFVEMSDQFNAQRSMFSVNTSVDEKLMEEQSRVQQRLTEATNETLESLHDELGEELCRRLLNESDENTAWMLDAIVGRSNELPPDQATMETKMDEQWSGDTHLPTRIPRSTVADYAERLGLDGTQRAVLETLHDDYAERHRRIRAEKIEPISQVQSGLWQFDGETPRMVEPDERLISRMTEMRRAAMQAILENDREFFDQIEVALVLSDEQAASLRRLRTARRRAAWNVDANSTAYMYDPRGGAGAGVDLVALADELSDEIDLPANNAIGEMLARYRDESIDLYQRRFAQSLAMAEAQLRFTVASQRLQQQDGEAPLDYQRLYEEYLIKPQEKLRDINKSLAELNRSTLDELASALDEPAAERLRDSVRRASYPHVYQDPMAVHDQLSAARELDDLRPDQRRALDEIAVAYRAEYEASSRAQIDIYEQQQSVNLMDMSAELDAEQQQAMARRFMRMQQDLERAQFERRELNARTIRRLRSLLSPDQIRRVGGFPDPTEHQQRRYPW